MGASVAQIWRVGFDLKAGRMAGVVFGDPEAAVDVVFLHANGLNALAYRTMLAPLAERFHVLAVDLRGHGRSTLPAGLFGYASWRRHVEDVIELIGTHLRGAVTLAGHSLGATTALLAGGARPDLVSGVCLLEPVLLSPRAYLAFKVPGGPTLAGALMPLARAARRRRATFPSKAEALAALTGRGFFKTWPEPALKDYVEDGFVEHGDTVRLACAPAFEAQTFTAQAHDPWRALAKVREPVIVLRAQHGSTCPEASARRIAALRLDARVATVEGATHALPLERPDRARAAIETAAILAARKTRFREVE